MTHPPGAEKPQRYVPTQIEELLLRCEGFSPHYQIELRRDDRLDRMRVVVEARSDYVDPTRRAVQAALLAAHIKNDIGVSAEVIVNDPGTVERSASKARRVIDLRGKD